MLLSSRVFPEALVSHVLCSFSLEGPKRHLFAASKGVVTFFAKMAALPKSNTFASVTEWRIPRNTVLIEGARLHVTKLCQSTILFGIVWVLLSRCASDPVCGGTIRAAGVPSAERNALSGNVAAGTAARP